MSNPNLPMPERGANDQETIKNLFDTVMKLRKELEYALSHLDDGNMQPDSISADSIDTDTLRVGVNIAMDESATISWPQILGAPNTTYIDAYGIYTGSLSTDQLMATKGYIAELTVDQIDTSDKIANYLAGDTSDVNYIKIHDQIVEFITATVPPMPLYQPWTNFPDSPVLTTDYPYQVIVFYSDKTRLYLSTTPIYFLMESEISGCLRPTSGNGFRYELVANVWSNPYECVFDAYFGYVLFFQITTTIIPIYDIFVEANTDIFTTVERILIYFEQTTPLLGPSTVFVYDRNGVQIFWVDETHLGVTTTVTSFPIYTYAYTELTKLKQTFENDGVNYIPKMVLGAGSGLVEHPDYGKGYIYKGPTGLYVEYLHSVTGVSRILKLTDEGIDLTDFEAIKYSETVAVIGISQIWVQPEVPDAAKTKDIWVDTDDYSRYDVTTLTSGTTLLVTSNEVIAASGTFTITLHTATSAGVIKKIYNIGTGIITVAGTINGVVNILLYPNESVELITDGTNWRC